MTPSQSEQKARAQAESEHHLQHSAVDRMRVSQQASFDKAAAAVDAGSEGRTRKVRDANNAYAGEE